MGTIWNKPFLWNTGEEEILESETHKSIFIFSDSWNQGTFVWPNPSFWSWREEFLGFERDAYAFNIAWCSFSWILVIYGFANSINWFGQI